MLVAGIDRAPLQWSLAKHVVDKSDIEVRLRIADFGRFNIHEKINASAVDTNTSASRLSFVCIAGASHLLWKPKPDYLPR